MMGVASLFCVKEHKLPYCRTLPSLIDAPGQKD